MEHEYFHFFHLHSILEGVHGCKVVSNGQRRVMGLI